MARTLYRCYLYTVFLAMLILATVGVVSFLQPLLGQTGLHGNSSYAPVPTHEDVVRGAVFFGVSWIIAGILGGLHYWLIRRDMQQETEPGKDGVRAFFLNIAELQVAPAAIAIMGLGVIDQLENVISTTANYAPDISGTTALAIGLILLWTVLELERRRVPATQGAAIVFQRLHLYGVQLILLFFLTSTWISAGNRVADTFIFAGHASCSDFTQCNPPRVISGIGATVWIGLFWLWYGFTTRRDTDSILRRILHFASIAFGVGLTLYGIYRGIELGFYQVYKVTISNYEVISTYNFVPYILLGLVVVSVYLMWLWIASRGVAESWTITLYIGEAIATALLAGAFWWGIGAILMNLFQLPASGADWSNALALTITGIAYIPLDAHLHRSKTQHPAEATEARRGYVLAVLGGGALSAAIGGAIALYSIGSAALGSPLSDNTALHGGTAAFLVGAILLLVYLWVANREHLLSGLGRKTVPALAVAGASTTTGVSAQGENLPAVPESTAATVPAAVAEVGLTRTAIEEVLDELGAGKITREEAITRIIAMGGTKQPDA